MQDIIDQLYPTDYPFFFRKFWDDYLMAIFGQVHNLPSWEKNLHFIANKIRNPEMTTSYRQARAEIVRVISSINSANTKLLSSLNKLSQYQKQVKELLKELRDAQVSEKKAKEYLDEYMRLLYKTQLKIYIQNVIMNLFNLLKMGHLNLKIDFLLLMRRLIKFYIILIIILI